MNEYIAHISKDGERKQSVAEHNKNVADMSRDFAIQEMKEICYASGLLHDAGKYLADFQKRINNDKSVKAEHSIVGAKIFNEKYPPSAAVLLAELCIAGHHSGLPDCGAKSDTPDATTLYGRMKRETKDYSGVYGDINILPDINSSSFNSYIVNGCSRPKDLIEKFAFLTRYCFSCLTDADSTDTSEFMNNEKHNEVPADYEECLKAINNRFSSFKPVTKLQLARSEIQKQVFENNNIDSDLFLINMPTGSGKTLCSMKFALERAIAKKKKRIIYVIPFNSIIDQTYEEFQKIFGNNAEILRHQSTFSFEDESDTEDYSDKIAACENWNAKIIITTAVQFFDSIYGNKRGKLRKLHNMGDSIIVFDEIHTLPAEKLAPCLRAVEYITTLLHSEAVFMTATMPDFPELFNEYTSSNARIIDLIPDKSLFSCFRKCNYSFIGEKSYETLLQLINNCPASLTIFNKRDSVRKLYELCSCEKKYHLSTYMTPYDRMNIINRIKDELKKLEHDYPGFENVPDERRIAVFSTSLIEAGVDLDFPAVFRELSGLDSILQAGGRCNREGKLKKADVKIFRLEESKKTLDAKASVTLNIIEKYNDISGQETIEEYYNRIFLFDKNKIESETISEMCDDIRYLPLASYHFSLIESRQISVFVPRDEYSENIKIQMEERGVVNQRKIQKYCCSVYEKEFISLLGQGVVEDYGSGIYCLTNPDYYKDDIGIVFVGEDIYL